MQGKQPLTAATPLSEAQENGSGSSFELEDDFDEKEKSESKTLADKAYRKKALENLDLISKCNFGDKNQQASVTRKVDFNQIHLTHRLQT